jgi:general stress protein CsbA
MADAGTPIDTVSKFLVVTQPFARYVAALIAGVAITLTEDHSTYLGLGWLAFVVAVSLLAGGGTATAMNRFAWWATLVVTALTLLGLLGGRMSPSTALSLTIALVAFETSRAFTRDDRIWLWSTGILALGLSILYFNIGADDRTAAGLTGGWAIVAGIFGLIAVIDSRVKARRSARKPAASRSTTTKITPSTTAKAKSRGTKR